MIIVTMWVFFGCTKYSSCISHEFYKESECLQAVEKWRPSDAFCQKKTKGGK